MNVDLSSTSGVLAGWGFHGLHFKNRRETITRLLSIIIALVVAGVLLGTNGNIMAASIAVVGTTILFLSLYRLAWAFNILFASILLFDQFTQHESLPVTAAIHYFQNLNVNPYLPPFDAGVVSPFELHLLLVVFVWILHLMINRNESLVAIPLRKAILVLFSWICFSFAFGMAKDGKPLPALWETRALFYLAIFYFLVPQIIRTREQVRSLVWICIGVISFKAFQGIVYFASSGFSFWNESYMTASQEDPVFIVLMMVLLMTFALLGGESKQKNALLIMLLPLLLGFLVGNRRATYVSMGISIIALIVLLPRKQRRTMLAGVGTLLFVLTIYVAAFWNNAGWLGWPAQQVKSILFEDPTMMTSRNYSSNYYREVEKYNIEVTIQQSPVVGIGFGIPYSTPINLYLKFGLSEYITHNSLLWFFMKTGAIGFFFLMFFLNSFLYRSASIFTNLKDQYLKVLVALCMIALINQIVVTYVEMHFTYYRNMSFLGILMGLIPVIESLDKEKSDTSPGQSVGA